MFLAPGMAKRSPIPEKKALNKVNLQTDDYHFVGPYDPVYLYCKNHQALWIPTKELPKL